MQRYEAGRIERGGARPGLTKDLAEQRFAPYRRAGDLGWLALQERLAGNARMLILDASEANDGVETLSLLWMAVWDRHPNAGGQTMPADALASACT